MENKRRKKGLESSGPTMRIGDRTVGEEYPVFIVAEIGINHNGSLQIAKKLIDVAVAAKVDAVKFQKRSIKHLYQEKVLASPNTSEQSFQYMLPILQDCELSSNEYAEIVQYCKEKKIIFLCSPWDIPSVDVVDALGVPVFKISSADMTNFVLLDYVISKKKPLILSTGMATIQDIRRTVDFVRGRRAEFALLHCNGTYPTPFEEVNLRFMGAMKKEFGPVLVGYSGHERGIVVSTVAAALGAFMIERHITLDRTMTGPDHAASLEPEGVKKLAEHIRRTEEALGTGTRRLNRMEVLNREVLGKSLVAAEDIRKGSLITRKMIGAKGPGKGISPQYLEELIGQRASHDILRDEFFSKEELKIKKIPWSPKRNIGKWGFVCRPHDMNQMRGISSSVIEVRFSDIDLESDVPKMEAFKQTLVVHAPEYWHRSLVDISSLDDTVRARSVEVVRKVIEKTKELSEYFQGRPKIVIHPGGMSMEPMGHAETLNANMELSLTELDSKEVILLPENFPPRPWFFGGEYFCNNFLSGAEIKEFCQRTGRRICFDVCHAQLYCNLKRENIAEFIGTVRPYNEHLHISDAYGVHGEGVQIEDGEIDFKAVIPPMFNNYTETWIPEIWRGHQNNFEGYYEALERLEKYFP